MSCLQGLNDDLVALDKRINNLDAQVERQVYESEEAQRLHTIPRVGPLTTKPSSPREMPHTSKTVGKWLRG